MADRKTGGHDLWDRWEEIDALFDAALDRPPAERDSHLEEACGDDVELLAAVRRVLRAAVNDDQPLAAPGAALVRAVLLGEEASPAPTVEPGTLIGRYRIVRELGHGGMATVYDAERADGAFDQHVALKLLRRGLDTDEVIRRFLAERQILSGLEHPNIARLIDGGEAPDGRPFLVMERVTGEPITGWADRHRLSIRARLDLFLQVARAVQFAHGRLIVHRDLKPSNILVDEAGQVKLLDFGIAKLLDPAGVEELTRTGVRPLTPAFASPEQVGGEAVTTASDVYQLGVLLYILLTGRLPFTGRGEALAAAITTGRIQRPSDVTVADFERAPSGEDATSADTADPQLAARAAVIAGARDTTPVGLSRALRGDLDAIILMAMRTESERRYASAADLASDVGRFLAREPVLARPDTLAYRARRFASRRPGIVAAALAATLVTGAYVVTLNVQARRLAAQRDIARTESGKAKVVSDFLINLFRENDPDRAAGETPDAFELLERGEQRVHELDVQPAVHAEVLSVIGQMYTLLGRYDRAEPMLRQALDTRRSLHEEPHADLALTLDQLGDVLQRTGRYDEAEPLLGEAIETARLAGDRALESDGYTDLGHSLIAHGEFAAAESAYARALELRRALFGDRHERTATSVHNLALALEEQERFDEAERLYREALDVELELLPAEHSSIALTRTTLARLYSRRGQWDQAEPLLRDALEASRKRLGPRHVRLGLILNELGTVSARRRDWAAAERSFRESLEINEAALGSEHAEIAVGLNNVSYVLVEQGRFEEALPMRRRALRIARDAIGADHQNTGLYAYNLAYVLEQLGRDSEAERYFRESLSILERSLPEGHAMVTRPLASLGGLLARTGRPGQAEPLLRTALHRRTAAGEAPASIAEVESLLGDCLARLGRPGEARPLLEKALATLEQALGPDAARTSEARARLRQFRNGSA